MGVEGCLNNGQRARMTRACGVRIFAVALVFLLFPPAPSALSSPLAPLHPLCLHSPRSSLLHLRGGHAASAEKPKGKPVFTKASGSGKAGKTAAGGPASDTAKEALYQLTTQLLGSGPPTGKKDLYEVLEVSKSASVKEIRDSYYKEPPPPPPYAAVPLEYQVPLISQSTTLCDAAPSTLTPTAPTLAYRWETRSKLKGVVHGVSWGHLTRIFVRDGQMARRWHPDKNPDDPNAEARFKLISEAYEILSDVEKRKVTTPSEHAHALAPRASPNCCCSSALHLSLSRSDFVSLALSLPLCPPPSPPFPCSPYDARQTGGGRRCYAGWREGRWAQVYLTESVYKVVFQTSIPAQIRQLILHYY